MTTTQQARSVHNLVPGQTLQTLGIGLPVRRAFGGDAPVVVEVYALGVGVTLVGEGGNLRGTKGTLELEANGKRLVIDPLHCRKTDRLVAGGSLSVARTAILSLPAGWGKTAMARPIAEFLGCTFIVEEWLPGKPILPGALHLTNEVVEGGAA
ncbi:hypothetical protein [Diaphorobacter nitroreducens]|uniref:hypothetical protein n=1 Tax=Diaphorobacter nitroreducens TaxID=164759 RepID=UPI0011E4C9E0|nr:hypothetical protein [Diaphorobacter nitroreducens]